MQGKNFTIMVSILVLLIPLVICAQCEGKVIYVDDDALVTGGGSSWADAFCCLQQALAGAGIGDEIRVAAGTYKPDLRIEQAGRIGTRITASGARMETFQLLSGVTIKGGYAGVAAAEPDARDINLYESILSGDLSANDLDNPDGPASEESRAENSYHVLTGSGADETAVLDGFTITGGNANIFTNRNGAGLLNEYGSPQVINCTFNRNSAQYYGGGIYNYYGGPAIVNCTFTRNSSGTEGGGIYNYQSNLNLDNCTFEANSSHRGGGIHSGHGSLSLTGCTFIGNLAHTGAGINSYAAAESSADEAGEDSQGTPILVNCTFTANSADDRGGGLYSSDSKPSLNNCTFSENSAGYGGGGTCFNNSEPNLTGCSINENSAYYGGGIYNDSSSLTLTYCTLIANSGYDYGGGMYNLGSSSLSLNNCIIAANWTNSYGGGIYNSNSDLALTSCTFTENSARDGSAVAFNSVRQIGQSTAGLIDCILWDDGNVIWINDRSIIAISYSDIRGGWIGTGNIDADPLFTDPNGPDDIFGTEDDDLRLAPSSPCVDAGDPNYAPGPNKKDFGGNPRVESGRVDMGAYESQGIIYVDNYGLDGPGQIDRMEDGSAARPFDTIQEAINVAKDSQMVLVRPGVYESINFEGKAITVAGIEGAAVIEATMPSRSGGGTIRNGDAITFHTGEGPGSVLKNFIIRNSEMAISLNYGSSPTITNLTIVDNDFGVSAYENSNPDISNCIFWNNEDGDLFQCQARYSCFESETPGEGNISGNPLFVDPAGGDYHLMSEGWRWSTYEETWVYDDVTSPCIDAGDPASPLGDEPTSVPRDPENKYGINMRINMGAYGGTVQASLSPAKQNVPGRASGPSPADGAIDVESNVILRWNPGANADSHDVYFGTDDSLEFMGNQTTTEFDPGWLDVNTTYFWRIDEVNSNGTRTGILWSFTTGTVPVPPPKGRTCFVAETGVWVDGTLVSISKAGARRSVGCSDAPAKNSSMPLPCLGKVQELQEHEGTFECYDILLQSGNSIGVAGNHYFLTESGGWVAVQNLNASAKLHTPKGPIGIVSVTKRPTPYVGKVYNLKVEGSDRYLVGKDAVIVRDY